MKSFVAICLFGLMFAVCQAELGGEFTRTLISSNETVDVYEVTDLADDADEDVELENLNDDPEEEWGNLNDDAEDDDDAEIQNDDAEDSSEKQHDDLAESSETQNDDPAKSSEKLK